MTYEILHLWGDSLGKGVVFDDGRGRYCITPQRCMAQLEAAMGIPMRNHARMGATVEDGYADYRQAQAEPGSLVVIEFGGNDCDMPWAEISDRPAGDYDGRVPLARFAQVLRQFVDAVRAGEQTPLLVTPPPLDAQRYFDWVTKGLRAQNVLQFLGDVQHIYRWQERYAIAVRNVAAQARCALFDMRDAMLARKDYPQLLCTDGIHLNAAGHTAVTQAVLAARTQLSAMAI